MRRTGTPNIAPGALNADQAAVCRWLSGKARPSFNKMLEMAQLSEGFIQIADWGRPLEPETEQAEA